MRHTISLQVRPQQGRGYDPPFFSLAGVQTGSGRTKRHSPASANGLVVNHSHMNALVDPSFTELIKPRMSWLTGTGPETVGTWGRVARTLKAEVLGGPALLQRHHVRHNLAAAVPNDKHRSAVPRLDKGRRRGLPAISRDSERRSPEIRYLLVRRVPGASDHSPATQDVSRSWEGGE